MKRAAVWTGVSLLAGLAAWQAASALQDTPDANAPQVAQTASPAEQPAASPAAPATSAPAPKAKAAPAVGESKVVTPMAERVATIGVLNKRNGLSRDLTMKPGDAVRMGDLVVRLRACEQTAPWEPEKWTGAFVQVITAKHGPAGARHFRAGCTRKARRSTSSSIPFMTSGSRPAKCAIPMSAPIRSLRVAMSRAVLLESDPGL